jgi:hypothetical protein
MVAARAAPLRENLIVHDVGVVASITSTQCHLPLLVDPLARTGWTLSANDLFVPHLNARMHRRSRGT